MYIYVSNESLGSVEAFFDDILVEHKESKVTQVADYYPFGMQIKQTSTDVTNPLANKYLYNGKELQTELGLDWYDYGARMYDPVIGRWHVVDPLSSVYTSYSPYSYVLNQPSQAIDPDGMSCIGCGSSGYKNDYHIDPATGTVIEVETPFADRVFVNGQLVAQGSYDGEYADMFAGSVDKYYSNYSLYFNDVYGDLLLDEKFVTSVLQGPGANEMKAEFSKAVVRQAINTNGVEVVMYILEVYGTIVTLGELTAVINGLAPIAKTYIKKYIKERAAKGVTQYSDDLVKAAQKLYPKKAGTTELHHITPKYLGGAKNGPLVPLDGAYHQQITNAFRKAWGYGQVKPNAAQLKQIMDDVYKQFPLPPG